MEALSAAYFRSRVWVYFQGRYGARRVCNQVMLEKILEAAARGDEHICWNASFKCDLQTMKLVNIKTLEAEDIVLEFRWDPTSLVSIVAQKRDKMVARKVLVMALERFRRTPNLRKILALKGLPTCTIRENPYLCPGHPPHDNFVESLLDFFEKETTGGLEESRLFRKDLPSGRTFRYSATSGNRAEHFLESVADGAGSESFNAIERGGIRTVFHGTNHAVMHAILFSGLDPKCRSQGLQEDYFGVGFELSLAYTRKKTVPPPTSYMLLVFMLLNPVEKTRNLPASRSRPTYDYISVHVY